MSTTDTRAAFEYWFSDEGAHPKAIERSSNGGYILAAATSAWNVWQAATEAAKATGTAELPPLPEAIAGGPLDGLYTANQMREYARSCEKGALARGAAAMVKDFAAREPMSRDHADCQSCVDGKCTTGDYCVTLGLDDDPLYWKQRALKAEAARQPAPAAQPYRHIKSGKLYELLHIGALEADLTVSAIYRCTQTGQVWVRPMTEFTEKFELAATNRSHP